ncbi:MAG: DUF1684 domain-containing protein [Acidobacteriota bacterium]
MYGQHNSKKLARIQAAITAVIFLLVPILVVITSKIGEKHNSNVTSDAGSRAYIEEIDAWHGKRIANLKKEQGWLSLVALTWLHEGDNRIDSIGTATLKKGRVSVAIDPGVNAALRGGRFVSGAVKTDADTSGADKIVVGTRAFMIIERSGRFAIRMWDASSPVRTHFTDIERYPVSERWKIAARWEPYAAPKHVSLETVIPGITDEGTVTGAAVFTIGGKEYRLEPIVEDPQSDYFFIVSDATNGKESYGGGRFLYTAPPKNDTIVLDFNKMTNPPCAFTEFATCPRPLPSNRLPVRIEAGEKKFGSH